MVRNLIKKTRNVRDEFNISVELLIVSVVWTVFELLFFFDAVASNYLSETAILVMNICRNYTVVVVSGIIPLIKSYRQINLPICTTKECASNFHLLMISEKTYNAFYSYLKENSSEGLKMLNFWTEINVFKHSNKHNTNKMLATDIYSKYLREGSDSYIDFPSHLLNNINQSYLKTSNTLYNDVFDDLGEFAYNSLQTYDFPNFKKSEIFKGLEIQLEREEVIYSRLVASSMISSLEIE